MNFDHELVIIGGGTAGLVSAVVAKQLGANVLLVEGARIGGECLWTGCVPSKTLIQSARVLATVQRAAEFGVHTENTRVIWRAVQLRIAAVRDEIRRKEQTEIKEAGLAVLKGMAQFHDANTIAVATAEGVQTIRARKFILAVGLRHHIPNIEGLAESGYLTNDTLFDVPALPRSLAIIGGGPLGCELAQALARLGTRVSIFQQDEVLLSREDKDVSHAAYTILKNEGVQVHLNANVFSISREESGVKLQVKQNGGEDSHSFSEVLLATDKEAHLENLNLGAANVNWSPKGVTVDSGLRTSAKNIWACGDVTGQFLFTHYAEHQARVAAQNSLLPVKAKTETRVVPWTTFLDPEIARIGLTESESRAQGDCKIYRSQFADLDRAIIEGETEGFLKIVASGSGRILGAHIVGAHAGELINSFVAAVRDGMLVSELADTIHVYPTLSEIGHRAGQNSYRELLEKHMGKSYLTACREITVQMLQRHA